MIEIRKDELKMDEVVLKYATNDEVEQLNKIAMDINTRAQKGGACNE